MTTDTAEITFTAEQLDLIQRSGSQYVEACPGAGKTQAIAERFIQRPNGHPRKGIALLSFTNAAADEARHRCSTQPDLLLAPNFVGTIDKFINRFIVTPALAAEAAAPCRFVDVWSQLPHTTVQCKGVPIQASLDWFAFDADGSAELIPQRVPPKFQKKVEGLEAWAIARLQDGASAVLKRLQARGYHDADSARRKALQFLSTPAIRTQLTHLLRARFAEVIVDEVQDCSDDDVLILEWVKSAAVELVLVGDPDQAIYGFRGRSTDANHRVAALVPAGTRLSGNFRSSPAICRIGNSLRSSSAAVDEAVGQYRTSGQPVLLYRYSRPRDVAKCAQKLADRYGFTADQSVVLAHGKSQAAQCAGGAATDSAVTGRLARIAVAIECLVAPSSTGKQRKEALDDLVVCLHEGAHKEFKELSRPDLLDALNTTDREHMATTLRLAFAVRFDRTQSPSDFKQRLAAALERNGFHWVRAGTMRAKDKWSSLPSNKVALLNHGSIHSFKGLQQQFVVLVIPDNGPRPDEQTGVGQWCSGTSGEERQVLYVGATRAAQTLLLAVHGSVYDRVHAKLTADRVPFDIVGD